MRVSYYAPNYLDRLPTELFPLIIDNIGLDLVAHVTFCKLLPRVKHCYKGRGRAFWEPICRTSGLVCPQCSRDDDRAWSSFAIECGEHAERCKHPACGMTRLRENEKLMQAYVAEGRDVMSTLGLSAEDDHDLHAPSVYKYIAFARSGSIPEMAWLRLNPEDKDPGTALYNHPIVENSFAVFPPAVTLNMMLFPDFPDPHSDVGVTVNDLLDKMVVYLQKPANNFALSELMDRVGPRKVFPATWSASDMFRALETMGDWFRIVHWVGIDHEETTEGYGPAFAWRFNPRALPENPLHLYRQPTSIG